MDTSVGVVAKVESFLQLEALVASSRLALGARSSIVCEVPPSLLVEKALIEAKWPRVYLVKSHQASFAADFGDLHDYWMRAPAGLVREIRGILPALDILRQNPKCSGISGFERDFSGNLSTSAYVSVRQKYGDGVALIPHEMSKASWRAAGPYATSRADAVGGFGLFRSDDFLANLMFFGGEAAQALASLDRPEREGYLLSSAFLTRLERRADVQTVALAPSALPTLVFERWKQAGLSRVKVLDLGMGLLNEQEKLVVFYPLPGFELVDESVGGSPFYRPSFWKIPENRVQLGPGFRLDEMPNLVGRSDGVQPENLANLTWAEAQLLSYLRFMKARLPRWVLKIVESFFQQALGRRSTRNRKT